MSGDLVVSNGGAVVPASGGAGDYVDDAWQTHAPSFDWSPKAPASVVEVRRQMVRDLIIDGFSEQMIDSWAPVLNDYAPAMRAAFATSNRQELTRLANAVRDDLLRKELISAEQLPRIRVILERYSRESEAAMLGAEARNTSLIDEKRELNMLMAKPGSRYWKGPDAERLQQRWRELFDQGVRAEGKRTIQIDDVDKRMAEIESLMGRPNSEYYRGANADALQSEYRDLIEQRARAQRKQ